MLWVCTIQMAFDNIKSWLPLVLLCTWDKFVQVATDYWLTIWIAPEQSFLRGLVPDSKDLGFWLPIYIGGAVAAGVSVYWRSCAAFNSTSPSSTPTQAP